tara:strand:+ start:1187 stop:1408 length:222 start_codon:yes stop_codon:yes gene_type:complete
VRLKTHWAHAVENGLGLEYVAKKMIMPVDQVMKFKNELATVGIRFPKFTIVKKTTELQKAKKLVETFKWERDI